MAMNVGSVNRVLRVVTGAALVVAAALGFVPHPVDTVLELSCP